MKRVRFLVKLPPYNAGEVAGFHDQRAEELSNLGVAELLDEAAPPPSEMVPAEGRAEGEQRVRDDRGGDELLRGNVADIADRVISIEDVGELQALRAAEATNESPRKGVLRAIDDRLARLSEPPSNGEREQPADAGESSDAARRNS